MNLREFLDQRERELVQEITDLHGQVAPKEAELAEIRRAKAAIGMPDPNKAPDQYVGISYNDMPTYQASRAIATTNMMTLRSTDPHPDQKPENLLVGEPDPPNLRSSPRYRVVLSPYDKFTMKQLVVKALREHFQNGATTRQMLEFFRDAWGRPIGRTNLSPQLSRLYNEGMIGRIRSTRGWFLFKRDDVIVGFRPYLHQGRVIWAEPTGTRLDYEPLLAKEIVDEVAKDRMPYKRTIMVPTYNRLSRSVSLVWLLPHEVTDDDTPALRHEFPPPSDDED